MKNNNRTIILTIIAAFMLAMMPLPDWAIEMRPDWVTLILIFWAMALPENIGVTVAWIAGLMLDVAHGSVMGQHALGLAIVIWVINMQHQRLRVASLLQQALVVFSLLFLKQLLVLWVNGIMGKTPDSWLYFLPSLTGAILWPWIYIILTDIRQKFGHRERY